VRARLQHVHQQWVGVLQPAFERGLAELGLDPVVYPARAVVALVVTFNEGVMLERLSGVDSGHHALLKMIDDLLERLEEARRASSTA
jgi:hypothetical protein